MPGPEISTLLEGHYAPTTFSIGFFEAALEDCVVAMKDWYDDLKRSHTVECQEKRGLPGAVAALSALSMPWYREVLVQPAGGWTAYLNNAVGGTDAHARLVVLSRRLGRRSLGITSVPGTFKGCYEKKPGSYGAVVFELRGPFATRVVSLVQDGRSRWCWDEEGAPFSFEETATYSSAPRRNQRFTTPMLIRYCAALGIDVTTPAFFDGSVVLLDSTHPDRLPNRVLAVEEARAIYGLPPQPERAA